MQWGGSTAGSVTHFIWCTLLTLRLSWVHHSHRLSAGFSPSTPLYANFAEPVVRADRQQSWRSAQYLLAGCGVLSFLLVFFFLPETSHPPLPHDTIRAERGKKFVFYYFNPLTSLGLFRWWNIVLVVSTRLAVRRAGIHLTSQAFTSSCVMLETYCFVVSTVSFRLSAALTPQVPLGKQ